jgi:hypothetical protein
MSRREEEEDEVARMTTDGLLSYTLLSCDCGWTLTTAEAQVARRKTGVSERRGPGREARAEAKIPDVVADLVREHFRNVKHREVAD